VAWDEEGHCRACSSMSYMPKGENRASETRRFVATPTYPNLKMGSYYHGFYYGFA